MIRRSTWILLGAFLVLGAGAILWQRSQEQSAAEATPSPGANLLLEAEGKAITGLRISAIAGGLVEIEKDAGGAWALVNLPAEIADGAMIESVISEIEGMRVLSQIDSPPSMDVIGLDPPAYRLTIVYDDGSKEEVLIGAETTTQSGYYATQAGSPVVVLNAFNVENILKILTDLPIVRSPTPSPFSEATEPTGTPQP
jgi:hypothetical protein